MSSTSQAARSSPELARRGLTELMRGPLMVGLAEERRRYALEQLAFLLMRVPETDPQLCVNVLGERVVHPLWNEQHLAGRAVIARARTPGADRADARAADGGLGRGTASLRARTARVFVDASAGNGPPAVRERARRARRTSALERAAPR